MTTYSFQIILNEDEVTVVQAALEHYKAFCLQQASGEGGAPYESHCFVIDAVLWRLMANPQMTSTSSFCWSS
jgi:hypothetical protein